MVSMLIEDMLLDLDVEVVGPATKLDDALALAREADIEPPFSISTSAASTPSRSPISSRRAAFL